MINVAGNDAAGLPDHGADRNEGILRLCGFQRGLDAPDERFAAPRVAGQRGELADLGFALCDRLRDGQFDEGNAEAGERATRGGRGVCV